MINNKQLTFDFIEANMKIKIEKKIQAGEVFTPLPVIEEMLNQLPQSIFLDKDILWGDILGSGIGNFSVAVYYRLMEGLKHLFKNEKLRQHHIINNMLYFCEKDEDNCKSLKQIFGEHINLFQDGLQYNPEFQFDVIMGNPPFNRGGIKSSSKRNLGEYNETIWPKFVKKAITLLKPSGYLLLITPLSWLQKCNSIHNELLQRKLYWLTLADTNETKRLFKVYIPISMFALKNEPQNQIQTKITTFLKRNKMTHYTILNNQETICIAFHTIMNKLKAYIQTHNLELDFKHKVVKSVGNKLKLKEIADPTINLLIDSYTQKDGILVKLGLEIHPDTKQRKLIISNKTDFKGTFIDEGRFGLTGFHKFYLMGNDLEKVLEFFSYKIIKLIPLATRFKQSFLDKEALQYIPDLRKVSVKDEDDFYKQIGLDDNELSLINIYGTAKA